MSKHTLDKRNGGFSLVETLAAVAILVILLSLSAVAAAYYRDYLKITELDNAAREIYMAAENRAVLLNNGKQLDSALDGAVTLAEGEADSGLRYITGESSALKDLLPAGAIDPALLAGDFYIVYDQASGAVTDVFYTEGPEGIQNIDDAFLLAGDRDARMRATPMLGYYGGEQDARARYTPLSAPEVMVVVKNEEELTVEVTFKIPPEAKELTGENWAAASRQTVRLQYGSSEISLLALDAASAGAVARAYDKVKSTPTSITYTWVLDSLNKDQKGQGQHFYQLFNKEGTVYGGDFTVTAEIELRAVGHIPASASGSDTGNSLFAELSGGSTARLETLRHLQNLDVETSHAGGKTDALQLADICCYGNDTYGDYEFIPIENRELAAFSGGWGVTPDGTRQRNRILSLHVTKESAAGKDGAGLFSATENKDVSFTGVRLMDAVVEGRDSQPAGALVGNAKNGLKGTDVRVVNGSVHSANGYAGGIAGRAVGFTELTNCQVYWEPEAGHQNLRSLLGSDMTQYQYKITGSHAGGLVGYQERGGTGTAPKGEITITRSLAASTIKGTANAGGLIGYSQSTPITLAGSYADCYLTGGSAAGLVGHLTTTTTISNCYAAGFIDMEQVANAAGLCLGPSAITTENVYSAIAYPGRGEPGNSQAGPYMICQSQATSRFTNTYYLGEDKVESTTGTQAEGRSYGDLSAGSFVTSMGGSFESKGQQAVSASRSTHPYNLQEKQNLTAYPFPGLRTLPHYGDWRAEFKEPSLVYYEQYDKTYPSLNAGEPVHGFSGGNARSLIGKLEENGTEEEEPITVRSDGYAVALKQSDLPEDGLLSITYRYFTAEGTPDSISMDYFAPGKGGGGVKLLTADWLKEEGAEYYYLAPLPEELVTGNAATKDFYQYLHFEIHQKLDSTVQESPSGEYFYNPHFAETVKPYTPVDGNPLIDWTVNPSPSQEAADQYITQTLIPGDNTISVSIRTPRHLHALSRYEDYYHNDQHALAFQQSLDLNYQEYTGHDFQSLAEDGGSKLQLPIGTNTAPFLGSYDGGCHSIEHMVFHIPTDESGYRVCMGLFGRSNGTLKNIVYKLDPEATFARSFQGAQAYFGTLVGINGGTIQNCAVEGVRFNVRTSDANLYIGGLVGVNDGAIQNCAADLASLFIDASTFRSAYVGGLAGQNNNAEQGISSSYAVGRLSADSGESETLVSLCGFVCRNYGRISNSYAAMDIKADGAGATAHGFCSPNTVGIQSKTYYLNRGYFTYREQSFLADYAPIEGAIYPQPLTYKQLTTDPAISGMGFQAKSGTEAVFPYPTGVKNGEAQPIHYGAWPVPMKMGSMGVYYWEELWKSGKSSYYISFLGVDPDGKQVFKDSNLSTLHDEGGEVMRYGYGFYSQEQEIPVIATSGLLYSEDSAVDASLSGALDAVYKDLKNPLDTAVDEELAILKEGLTFHSFHSFGLDAEKGGLYPGDDSGNADKPSNLCKPNGALTLTYYDENAEEAKFTFLLNPHFADALAVETLPEGWTAGTGGVSVVTRDANGRPNSPDTMPGGKDNHYDVRSIEQLELINWNRVTRNTRTVVELKHDGEHSIQNFPYLSSSSVTGKYFWEQTYDVKGRSGQTYTPIAEYYDSAADTDNKGSLDGWFGGTYDGGGYVIENVDIQGQLSSVAGLFGVVYNGTLENIVLYSSSGRSTVASGFYDGSNDAPKSTSQWYAIGALAGVAASHGEDGKPGGSAIVNCAVSGYTIEARTFTNDGANAWGGAGVGGLLGLSNMNLTGCTAVTTIHLADGSSLYDNIRTGGLVGSGQGSITNCYVGGEIAVSSTIGLPQADGKGGIIYTKGKQGIGIYIGSTVGGTYMKPLSIAGTQWAIGFQDDPLKTDPDNPLRGWCDVKLTNCYSYVRLPSLDSHPAIKGLFAVGGAGELNSHTTTGDARNHGECTTINCYYLASEVLLNNGGTKEGFLAANTTRKAKTDLEQSGVTGLTYEQLTGSIPLDGGNQKIYELLTDFRPVSTMTLGSSPISVPGKYSYPPATEPALQGQDYPFPTILTKSTQEGDYRVHYGRWPLNGIRREDTEGNALGAMPITIDLFVSEEHQETLVLTSETLNGGVWSQPIVDETIAAAEIGLPETSEGQPARYTLTVSGRTEGSTTLKLTYTKNGVSYPLSISIHVNADVKLLPSTVCLFPNDTVTVKMRSGNTAGTPITDDKGALELRGTPSHSAGYLTAQVVQPEGAARDHIQFTTKDAPLESSTVSAEFTYTTGSDNPDSQKEYKNSSPIQIQILALPVPEFKLETITGADGAETKQTICTLAFDDITVDGGTEDTLTFQVTRAALIEDDSGPDSSAPTVTWIEDLSGNPNGNTVTLTYPAEEAPPVKLFISLKVSSQNGRLIPAGEFQIHELTMSVAKPAAETLEHLGSVQTLDALPPAEDPSQLSQRRRRHQRRRALNHKL